LNALGDQATEDGDGDEEWQVGPVPEAVEDVAGEQQKGVVEAGEAVQTPGDGQYGEEEERVFNGGEQHG